MNDENFEEALIEFADRVEHMSTHFEGDLDLKEFLLNVEEIDKNFDRLSLIKIVKKCLDDEFSVEIASQCKNHESTQIFLKSIKKTSKFVKFKQRLNEILMENASKLTGQMPPQAVRQRAASDFNGSDFMNSSCSWMSSSPYGQSTLFVGKNVLKRSLAILETKSTTNDDDLTMKRDVLKELSSMRSSDIAQSEHWIRLQAVMVDLLDREELYTEVLRFVVKLFNCQTHSIVVDVFFVLLSNLERFSSTNYAKLSLNDELNVEQSSNLIYLTKFRLFHSLIMSFPYFWMRYSDDLIARVIEKTFKFLAFCKNSSESYFNPLLTLALFDADSKWLQFWLFSTFSRTRFLSAMKTDDRFLTFILEYFFNHVDDVQTSNDAKNSKSSSWTLPSIYQSNQSKSLLWSQCCRTLTILIQYADVRNLLFPTKIDENQLDFNEFFHRFVDVWLSGRIKNVADVKFVSLSILKMSTSVKNHDIFLRAEIVFSFVDALSLSGDDRTTILSIFNEIFQILNNFRTFFNMDLASKNVQSTKLGQFLINYCSTVINLAWQKDPDAPLNLVYGAVKLCSTLCRYSDGRSTLSADPTLLPDVVRLAKDKTLSLELVFPLLTSCERRNDVKKFLYNSMNFSSRSIFYVWSTPLDFPCGNLIQKFVEYIRIVSKNVPSTFETPSGLARRVSDTFSTSIDRETDALLADLYVFLACPSSLKELLANRTFVDVVDASFVPTADENSSTFVLNLIRTALCQMDFVLALRRRTDQGQKLKTLLERNFFNDERQLEITRRSLALVEIYTRQKCLAGPNERLACTNVDFETFSVDVLFDSNCFRAEPSCFFIAKTSISTSIEIGNDDCLTHFLTSIESKQRISHVDLLLHFISNSFSAAETPTRHDSGLCSTDNGWNMLLEYGENLKIFDDLRKSTIELKNVLRFLNGLKLDKTSDDAVDWFVGMIFLMCDGRATKTVQFLNAFSKNSTDFGSIWPSLSTKNYRETILNVVSPLVERLCQSECPSILMCLHRNGIALSNLLLIWLNQNFLNFLDYPEIVNFLTLSILGGSTYQAFFCCCVLKYLSSTSICVEYHSRNLPATLSNGYNFRLHNYVSFLRRLTDLYERF